MIRMMMMIVVMTFCKMVEVMLAVTTSSDVLQSLVTSIKVDLKIHTGNVRVDVFEVFIIVLIESVFKPLLK